MEWRTVPGYERYEVSEEGQVRNRMTGYTMRHHKTPTGYTTVTLTYTAMKSRHVLLHRILLSTFVRPPMPDEVGRHLDGNPHNNALSNLAWGTQTQNLLDRREHGTVRNQNTGRTICVHGHALTAENTRFDKRGRRSCKACQRAHRQREDAFAVAVKRGDVRPSRRCEESACGLQHYARGMCRLHYNRAYRRHATSA